MCRHDAGDGIVDVVALLGRFLPRLGPFGSPSGLFSFCPKTRVFSGFPQLGTAAVGSCLPHGLRLPASAAATVPRPTRASMSKSLLLRCNIMTPITCRDDREARGPIGLFG